VASAIGSIVLEREQPVRCCLVSKKREQPGRCASVSKNGVLEKSGSRNTLTAIFTKVDAESLEASV
jgi:hypothetical protein